MYRMLLFQNVTMQYLLVFCCNVLFVVVTKVMVQCCLLSYILTVKYHVCFSQVAIKTICIVKDIVYYFAKYIICFLAES